MKRKLFLFLSILVLVMPIMVFAEPEEGENSTPSGNESTNTEQTTNPTASPEPSSSPTPSPSNTPSPSPSAEPKKEEKLELTLESVNIPGAKLLTTFSKDASKEYDVEITDKSKFNLTKVTVSKTSKSDKIKFIVSQLDSQNKFRIIVQNIENNDKLTYTFVVKEEEANANLSKLEINGYAFNEAFNKDTTSYTVTIPYDVTTVTINATPEDTNSKVSPGVTFTKDNLEVGSSSKNTVTIKVTNGNATKTYKIFITRSEESKLAEKATSIITSKVTSTDFDIPETTNPDSIIDYIIITLGSLVLFAIGAIGIYFYVKTSPKRMKKELLMKKNKKDESPIVETKSETIKEVIEKPKKTEIEEL